MRFHIVTGLLGPAFVLLHSGFAPYSSLGLISMMAMMIVVASGVAGRYLLTYMPASADGGELGRDVVQRRLEIYRAKLISMGLSSELLGENEEANKKKRRPMLITALLRVVMGDRENRQEVARLTEAVQKQGDLGEEAGLLLILVRRLCRERQLLVRYHELRRIIGTWRFLHRWFAIVLFLGALYHIIVAVRFGDLWVLGGGA